MTATLTPFAQNPTELVIIEDSAPPVHLYFRADAQVQKCSECWFQWFDTHLCDAVPCNSQGRTDGKMGTWREEDARESR